MQPIPYVNFPKVTAGAFKAFRNQGQECIRRAKDGTSVGLRVRFSKDSDPKPVLLFEAGEGGEKSFTTWCVTHRAWFEEGIIASLALVPHEGVKAAPELIED